MLRENYDGYHFSRESEDVFNPYSLMRCFAAGYMDNYWYASGTSTYLIHQMKRFKTDVTSLDDIFAFASSFDRPTDDMTDALPLLYQSGYLTIKKYDSLTNGYYLGIPNKEVRDTLHRIVINECGCINPSEELSRQSRCRSVLASCHLCL